MKPFLGIDLTEDKKNEKTNGKEFLTQKPSSAMTEALERSGEKAVEKIKKSQLPLPVRIVQLVCTVAAGFILVSVLNLLFDEDSVSLAQAYRNAPWLFWVGGICAVIFLVITLIGFIKSKKVLSDEGSTEVFADFESTCNALYTELCVPSEAKDTDILSFNYKIKDGNIKPCEKAFQSAMYFNPIYKIFADSENLYLADLEGKYAFPLSSLKAIRTVKKHITVESWNKDESFKKGGYKQYKITEDNDGIHLKSYHILELEYGGEQWGIYFPCYELPTFEELTGLKAE